MRLNTHDNITKIGDNMLNGSNSIAGDEHQEFVTVLDVDINRLVNV